MLSFRVPSIVVLTLTFLAFSPAHNLNAQLLGQAEGSRPGQTYVKGQATPQPAFAPAQAVAPVQPAPAVPAANLPRTREEARSAAVAGTPVILEFSDLQCPDSARYNAGLKTTIMQRYVTPGRAEYQWKDFPLPSHDKAVMAASAARCGGPAAEEIRRKIMAQQGNLTDAAIAQYAREAGVNMNQFTECVRSGQSRQAVLADKALGDSYGVRGTPTLVLGLRTGKGQVEAVQVVKAYDPPQQVLAQIDAFLARVTPQAAP